MDALTLLRRDHDTIKPLLREIKETTDRAEKGRSELFSKIKAEGVRQRGAGGARRANGASQGDRPRGDVRPGPIRPALIPS